MSSNVSSRGVSEPDDGPDLKIVSGDTEIVSLPPAKKPVGVLNAIPVDPLRLIMGLVKRWWWIPIGAAGK